MKVLSTCKIVTKPNVHARRFDNEVVILDLERGVYFGLDEVGAAMWDCLVQGHTVLEVVQLLKDKYQVSEDQLLEDVSKLMSKLTEEGLASMRQA